MPELITNKYQPQFAQITQVDDLDVPTLWAMQAEARHDQQGLMAYVSHPETRGFLADHGFQSVSQTYFAQLNIRDFSGEPVVPVVDLEADLKAELVMLLRDHYERTQRFNPPIPNIDYAKWLFGDDNFDTTHSIVRLTKQHIVAAILIFHTDNHLALKWTFGDDVATLQALWRDLLGILPIGSRLLATFDTTDVLAMSVYEHFHWHQTAPAQTLMMWPRAANNLRIQ